MDSIKLERAPLAPTDAHSGVSKRAAFRGRGLERPGRTPLINEPALAQKHTTYMNGEIPSRLLCRVAAAAADPLSLSSTVHSLIMHHGVHA